MTTTEFRMWDTVCDHFALEAEFSREINRKPLGGELVWVAELGIREGQWIRDHRELERRRDGAFTLPG